MEYGVQNPQIVRFFNVVSTRDSCLRSRALEYICKCMDNMLSDHLRSRDRTSDNFEKTTKAVLTNSTNTNTAAKYNLPSGEKRYEIQRLNSVSYALTDYLPVILRLSRDSPFIDIRQRFDAILIKLKEHGIQVPKPIPKGPSKFINMNNCIVIASSSGDIEQMVALSGEDDQTQMLFIDAFLQNNRLDHVTQLMGYHPKYLDCFLRTQHFLMRGDGPLPYGYRHYIAIMAVARHRCSYMINLQKQEFLLQGGDENWLKGLHKIPQKLRDLYELNKILAHRPWLINKSHIEKLTKGKDNWSLSEVVHAIVLLAHFHALSSFVHGCGITPELDHEDGHSLRPPLLGGFDAPAEDKTDEKDSNLKRPPPSPSSSQEVEGGVETLMQKMKKLSECQSENASQEEMVKRFRKVESQAIELTSGIEPLSPPKADISCYIEDPSFSYQDFAKRGEVHEIPTFRIQDYSWDDHAYSLVNRLYNDVGTLLDEKFKMAYSLTYYTMGGQRDVDTTLFRRAVWNYIHCIYGIRHDDFDYGDINHLLERYLKAYIKTVCCYPERTSRTDYEAFMREFRHSEKVHVMLMILDARMQAELLYALRAVMSYMT